MKNAATIRALMRTSWLVEESGESDEELTFATRDNGSVGDCIPGRDDILHARAMGRIITASVEGVKCYVDTCDEWTTLIVRAT